MKDPVASGSPPSAFASLAAWWGLLHCILFPCTSGNVQRPLTPPSSEVDVWAERQFAQFLAGSSVDGNVKNVTRPDWLDDQKVARARELHLQYWPVMNNAQVISLFMSFAFLDNTKPLLYTGRSDTAPRARRRYLETALHVHTWALGDIWNPDDPAYRSAEQVRGMHRWVSSQLDGRELSAIKSPGQLPARSDACGRPSIVESSNLIGDGQGDEGEQHPEASDRSGFCPAHVISQRGMAATQWFFVGLIVLHPEKFGLGNLTDYDLESFIHLWRSIGHRLGVDEKHNLCSGSLEQVRAVMHLVERRYLMPRLEEPQADWDAMTHALYDGLGQVFAMCRYNVWRYYLLHDVLEMEATSAYRALGWTDYGRYLFLRAIYRRGNQDQRIHAHIRHRAKTEFQAGVAKEKLPKQLTYVFDLI